MDEPPHREGQNTTADYWKYGSKTTAALDKAKAESPCTDSAELDDYVDVVRGDSSGATTKTLCLVDDLDLWSFTARSKPNDLTLSAGPLPSQPLLPSPSPSLCILLVIDEWGTSTGGIAAFNVQIAARVKEVNPDATVFVLLLNRYGVLPLAYKHPTTDQILDAAGAGVILVYPTICDNQIAGVPDCNGVTWIIGHDQITGDYLPKLKSLEQFKDCKLAVWSHTTPERIDAMKSRSVADIADRLTTRTKMLLAVDVVFSVGPWIYDDVDRILRRKGAGPIPAHVKWLPRPNPRFFLHEGRPRNAESIKSLFKILVFARLDEMTSYQKGADIAIFAAAIAATDAKNNAKLKNVKFELTLRGCPSDQSSQVIMSNWTAKMKPELVKLLDQSPLCINHRGFTTTGEIREDIQEHDLVLVPSRQEPFGLTCFEALQMTCPILVSSDTGAAAYLVHLFDSDADPVIVRNYGDDVYENWAKAILGVCTDYDQCASATIALRTVYNGLFEGPDAIQRSFQSILEANNRH